MKLPISSSLFFFVLSNEYRTSTCRVRNLRNLLPVSRFLYFLGRSLPGGYAITVFLTIVRSIFMPRLKHMNDGRKQSRFSVVEDTMTFRTWFCDIDLYGHMNNGSYNLYCDYGRYALAVRLFGMKWFNNAYCVVSTSHIQYIRSLPLFRKFTLRTSVVAVSGKNVWFRQR